MLVGAQADFRYDALAEVRFEDRARFETFVGIVGRRDEERFLDRGRMGVVVFGGVGGVGAGGGKVRKGGWG